MKEGDNSLMPRPPSSRFSRMGSQDIRKSGKHKRKIKSKLDSMVASEKHMIS